MFTEISGNSVVLAGIHIKKDMFLHVITQCVVHEILWQHQLWWDPSSKEKSVINR